MEFHNVFKLQGLLFHCPLIIADTHLVMFTLPLHPSTGIKGWVCVIPAAEGYGICCHFLLSVSTSDTFPLAHQIRTLGPWALWCTKPPAVQVPKSVVNPSTAITALASDAGDLSATGASFIPEDKAINLFHSGFFMSCLFSFVLLKRGILRGK